MMRSQVALLHSQLLFERHQCLQHARRNRRLLSKARTAMHVEEKVYSLVSLLIRLYRCGGGGGPYILAKLVVCSHILHFGLD
jgi:hypothetical protein